MLGGLVLAIIYFTSGVEVIFDDLSEADKKIFLSFRWWHIVVGVIYPSVMCYGIHLLYKRKNSAVLVYVIGCLIYFIANVLSYLSALVLQIESTASLEDVWFSILFACITGLVYLLSRSQVANEINGYSESI